MALTGFYAATLMIFSLRLNLTIGRISTYTYAPELCGSSRLGCSRGVSHCSCNLLDDTMWNLKHLQETERLQSDPAPGITASPHDDNLRYFDVTIQGPEGSPFEGMCSCFRSNDQSLTVPSVFAGGIFRLELFLPENYPMEPPKVRFLTKIYHPNIGGCFKSMCASALC